MVSLAGFHNLYIELFTFNLEHFIYMLHRPYPSLTQPIIFCLFNSKFNRNLWELN